MAQTVQINRRASGEAVYITLGQMNMEAAARLFENHFASRTYARCPSGILQSHQKASRKASRSYKSTDPFTLQLGSPCLPWSNQTGILVQEFGDPGTPGPLSVPSLPCSHLLALGCRCSPYAPPEQDRDLVIACPTRVSLSPPHSWSSPVC